MRKLIDKVVGWFKSPQINSIVTILVLGVISEAIFIVLSLFQPGFLGRAVWELMNESAIAVIISMGATTVIFWILTFVGPIRDLILPGKGEAEQIQRLLAPLDADASLLNNPTYGYLHLSLAIRGAARILAVAIIYSITLYVLAPLS